jgi:hypothetical protein
MCYAVTTTNDAGTVTACCYCGWSEIHDIQESAERHQSAPDDIDTDAATP